MLCFLNYAQSIIFIALIISCGDQKLPRSESAKKPMYHMDAGLAPFVAAYEADADDAGAPVPAEFRSQLVQVIWQEDLGQQGDEVVLGRCERFNENHPDPEQRFRVIKIRRPDANGYAGSIKIDALTLKTVVYHELGHCLHDFRGHLPEASHQIMSKVLPKNRFQSFHELLHQHFSLLKTGH
jgi:hypothetical protein